MFRWHANDDHLCTDPAYTAGLVFKGDRSSNGMDNLLVPALSSRQSQAKPGTDNKVNVNAERTLRERSFAIVSNKTSAQVKIPPPRDSYLLVQGKLGMAGTPTNRLNRMDLAETDFPKQRKPAVSFGFWPNLRTPR